MARVFEIQEFAFSMLCSLRQPSRNQLDQLIARQQAEDFTYSDVGASQRSSCPVGFRENRFEVVLGHGADVFARARAAIESFEMLNMKWLQLATPVGTLETGAIVCTRVRLFGVYAVNVGRVVYVDDEEFRFAFGYGTLPQYPMKGEERFAVSLDPDTDQVCFEIYSFAKAKNIIIGLGWPSMKMMQRRFCRDSANRMLSACCGG